MKVVGEVGNEVIVMRVIIAGSRNFNDYSLLKQKLDHFFSSKDFEIEIVSGTAKGADQLGEQYAKEKGYSIKRFPADWKKHGKAAGPIRNEEMAKHASHCICFWDGESRGTKSMIDLATKYNLQTRVILY